MSDAARAVPLRPLGRAGAVAGGVDLDVDAGGLRLGATRWRGGGTPVVLLHGLASQRRFWNLVVPGLAGLDVVALDQRGHGDSDRPDAGYGFPEITGDVRQVMDALAIPKALIVGHSWGAWTALAFAAAFPERTLAVVAIDGGVVQLGADDGVPRAEMRKRMEPPRFAAPPEEIPTRLASGALGAWWSDEIEQAVLPLFGVGSDGLARARLPFECHMQIVDAILDYRAEDVLPSVRCPAWIVACEEGRRSGKANADLDRAVGLLAAPRPLRWGAALHDVPLQWPHLVAGLIRAAACDPAR